MFDRNAHHLCDLRSVRNREGMWNRWLHRVRSHLHMNDISNSIVHHRCISVTRINGNHINQSNDERADWPWRDRFDKLHCKIGESWCSLMNVDQRRNASLTYSNSICPYSMFPLERNATDCRIDRHCLADSRCHIFEQTMNIALNIETRVRSRYLPGPSPFSSKNTSSPRPKRSVHRIIALLWLPVMPVNRLLLRNCMSSDESMRAISTHRPFVPLQTCLCILSSPWTTARIELITKASLGSSL